MNYSCLKRQSLGRDTWPSPLTFALLNYLFIYFHYSVSPAAMHLLGLNWQLQPADGHTFNNGIRTGLPGRDDVATMPSGGKGEVTAAACPLEVTGNFRVLASWFRFSNPNLGRYAKWERKGNLKKRVAFPRCPCSKLFAVPAC